MGKVLAGMTMSLYGFLTDRNGQAQCLSPDFEEPLGASLLFRILKTET